LSQILGFLLAERKKGNHRRNRELKSGSPNPFCCTCSPSVSSINDPRRISAHLAECRLLTVQDSYNGD